MHPSITLLLRYRSQVCMPPCDGYTSLFKLQSQATLLEDAASHTQANPSAQAKHTGQSPCSVGPFQDSSWHWDHPDAANRSKAHSVCWNPTKADRGKHHTSVAWSQESHFQEEPWVLLVHSPLLQQSRLLAVPPLSDMLKFGGSFHVRQVTGPLEGRAQTTQGGCAATPC